MRQSLKRCVFVVAAASGVLGAGGGVVYADAGAGGGATNSPGVLSGNNIQVTVDTPVNACGNSVDGGAALNPAMGNTCGNGVPPAVALHQPPPVQRTPVAQQPPGAQQAPGVRWTTPEPEHRAEPERRPAPVRAEHPAAAPVASAPGSAPRPAQEERAGAVARAGASAGSALLASTGPGELGVMAGVGGGLLVGGALLLRRGRARHR
ncbi:chaplin [Streptomyces decoyicus]